MIVSKVVYCLLANIAIAKEVKSSRVLGFAGGHAFEFGIQIAGDGN